MSEDESRQAAVKSALHRPSCRCGEASVSIMTSFIVPLVHAALLVAPASGIAQLAPSATPAAGSADTYCVPGAFIACFSRADQPPIAADDRARPRQSTPMPSTGIFKPLRADPKEPRFFVGGLKVDSDAHSTNIGAVGFGEHFGLLGRETWPGVEWQLGLAGAVFAQFDLSAPSSDLVNADYVIGLPVAWRAGDWSGRIRVYHQSSHIGDEYLLRVQPERVNLSYESVEVLAAYDIGGLRMYGGGEYLFRRDPVDLGKGLVHAGLDWSSREVAFRIGDLGAARWVAGLDVKRWQQRSWARQVSAKAGFEITPASSTSTRRWSALLEYYDGPSPYGQFYPLDLRYWGIAIQLGL